MQVEDPVAQPSPPIHNHAHGELTWQKNPQERMKKGKETKKKVPSFEPAQLSEPSIGQTSWMQVQPQHLLSQTAHVAFNLSKVRQNLYSRTQIRAEELRGTLSPVQDLQTTNVSKLVEMTQHTSTPWSLRRSRMGTHGMEFGCYMDRTQPSPNCWGFYPVSPTAFEKNSAKLHKTGYRNLWLQVYYKHTSNRQSATPVLRDLKKQRASKIILYTIKYPTKIKHQHYSEMKGLLAPDKNMLNIYSFLSSPSMHQNYCVQSLLFPCFFIRQKKKNFLHKYAQQLNKNRLSSEICTFSHIPNTHMPPILQVWLRVTKAIKTPIGYVPVLFCFVTKLHFRILD